MSQRSVFDMSFRSSFSDMKQTHTKKKNTKQNINIRSSSHLWYTIYRWSLSFETESISFFHLAKYSFPYMLPPTVIIPFRICCAFVWKHKEQSSTENCQSGTTKLALVRLNPMKVLQNTFGWNKTAVLARHHLNGSKHISEMKRYDKKVTSPLPPYLST